LRTEFETEKKEAQLAAQQEEIALQRKYARLERDRNNFLLAGLALSLLFIAVLYRMYHSNRKLSNRNAHLVREQGHRIRNHLQMISNMLQLNSDMLGDPEVKATLVESELRIQSVALLQKGLYGGADGATVFLPEYFTQLIDHVLDVSGYGWIEKDLNVAAAHLDPDRALPVALILNELVTNACKYAFPGNPSPRLWVKCTQHNGSLRLIVSDNGRGIFPAALERSASFGMQLVRAQAEQLYASYHFCQSSENGGVLFEMEFSV